MDLPVELIRIGYVIRVDDVERTVHNIHTPDTAPRLRHISFVGGGGATFTYADRIEIVSVTAATDDEFDV